MHYYILTIKHLKNKENHPITNCIKNNKRIGINLSNEVNDLYNENGKMLLKEIKGAQANGKTSHVHGLEEVI